MSYLSSPKARGGSVCNWLDPISPCSHLPDHVLDPSRDFWIPLLDIRLDQAGKCPDSLGRCCKHVIGFPNFRRFHNKTWESASEGRSGTEPRLVSPLWKVSGSPGPSRAPPLVRSAAKRREVLLIQFRRKPRKPCPA